MIGANKHRPILAFNTLNGLDRAAVDLAKRDAPSTVGVTGSGHRFVNLLFGVQRPSRLADRRLEALRSYAVLYRARLPHPAEGFGADLTEEDRHSVRSVVDTWPHAPAAQHNWPTRLLVAILLLGAGVMVNLQLL